MLKQDEDEYFMQSQSLLSGFRAGYKLDILVAEYDISWIYWLQCKI